MIEGHGDFGPDLRRVVDDVGEVGVDEHRRLVDDDQVTLIEFHGGAGTAAILQVTKELGEVVTLTYSCLRQHVAR